MDISLKGKSLPEQRALVIIGLDCSINPVNRLINTRSENNSLQSGSSHIDRQVIGCHDEPGTEFSELFLNGSAILEGLVHLCAEMQQGQAFCTGSFCNPDCILRVEVRPVRAALPGL